MFFVISAPVSHCKNLCIFVVLYSKDLKVDLCIQSSGSERSHWLSHFWDCFKSRKQFDAARNSESFSFLWICIGPLVMHTFRYVNSSKTKTEGRLKRLIDFVLKDSLLATSSFIIAVFTDDGRKRVNFFLVFVFCCRDFTWNTKYCRGRKPKPD